MAGLSFKVEFPPTPWKRPSGTTQRFDSQVVEKAAFALLVSREVRDLVPIISVNPYFKKHLPLSISLVFSFKRVGILGMPTNKNDIDNLTKFVLDALQSGTLAGKIWHDDGQIVEIHAVKLWSDNDLISCSIMEYTNV
jgi:Holliday junction resolvase RusA-like endonuclease